MNLCDFNPDPEPLGGCDNGHWAHYKDKSNHPCVNWEPIDWSTLDWEGLGV